jgi:cystathionine gamma-synthase
VTDWAAAGFETRAIHAGQDPDPGHGSVVVPVHLSSTFAQRAVGDPWSEFEYARSGNPTRAALETCLAALEGGVRGLAFASGLAAEDCLIRTVCRPGDHVIVPDDAYGGTYRLFAQAYEPWGLKITPVPLHDLGAVQAALRPGATRLLWCETPTNPLLGIADIAAVSSLARGAGALLAVDNTFASPYLQQPLSLGADVVVHSTTKYLGGHSDVVGGGLVAADPALGDRLAWHQNALGAVAGPFDAWLVLRGIKTLGVRMDRHCLNARAVVSLLQGHRAVSEVLWPGLDAHPGHEIAARQMRDYGGMVSFLLHGGEPAALEFCRRTRVFTLAESLGGVESLVEHPGRMTHASVAGSALEVPGALARLSVGIETELDLVADLRQALDDLA